MRERKDSENGDFEQGEVADIELADAEEQQADLVKRLRQELKACQKERQEFLDGWQRAKADHLNSKRRAENDRAGERERTAASFIETLLPLCDSFDMALRELARNGQEGEWKEGIERMYTQLTAVLNRNDVTILEPVGAPFDPREHEAVSEVVVGTQEKHHTVVDVLQKGYRVGERLIRPAKVVVGTYVQE